MEIYENKKIVEDFLKSFENGFMELKMEYPYGNLENIPDSTKGECSNCSKGLLSIDLKKSFTVIIYGKKFSFETIVYDRCKNVYLEKSISITDTIQIQSI